MAFVDLRQFNVGHTLVIPREHIQDVRGLDEVTGAALMATTARIARAVSTAFPNDGLSLWQSIGPAAFQESWPRKSAQRDRWNLCSLRPKI